MEIKKMSSQGHCHLITWGNLNHTRIETVLTFTSPQNLFFIHTNSYVHIKAFSFTQTWHTH